MDLEHTKVTDCGVQGLMQLLPESLQKFNLNPAYTQVSDLGKRTLPAQLTDLHAVAAGVPAVVRLEP